MAELPPGTALPDIALWDDPTALAARLAPVHVRMAAAVAERDGDTAGLYIWLRYHLGWADLTGAAESARAAKGIRPLVALLACEAVGGSAHDAVDAAAAVELTHEFSLVHDDLEDGDRLRRGRPALWAAVGAAQAINAGDALFAIARQVLTLSAGPPERILDQLRRYDAACLALAEGQFQDIGFERRARVSPGEYEAMVDRKTGAMLGLAAALGAAAAGATPAVADRLDRYGRALGVAFQMQDDLLGLWGDPQHTGKPAGADLMRKKKSMPIVLALADAGLGDDVAELLARDSVTAADAEAAAVRLSAAGLRERVTQAATGWVDRAEAALADLDLAPAAATALSALARFAVTRQR